MRADVTGGTKHMIQLDQTAAPHDPVETWDADGEKSECAFAQLERRGLMLQLPTGLVVSSDNEVRRKLAEILRQCGLAPVFASTVAESGTALAGHEVFIVLCNDCPDDGKYQDIVKLVGHSDPRVPVIVVSRTGDWPEYLTAICRGVFDYLAYPPIPGDLQQTIRNALLGHKWQRHFEAA